MLSDRQRPERAQRSELAVPAISDAFLKKAATSAADCVFLDLEDAIAPDHRAQARANAVRALQELEWGRKTLAVRVNAMNTPWGLRDVLDVARCTRLDLVLLPKVETAADVVFLERLLQAIEFDCPRNNPLGIEVLIETTKGLANVESIAASSPRLEAMIFGVGDYSIELENFDLTFGESSAHYAVLPRTDTQTTSVHWNDQWHYALARIANACRAFGLRPIDGPFANYADTNGYVMSCRRARVLGYEGKWAIHPSQIAYANEEFTPTEAQISWAKNTKSALEEAARAGRGAIGEKGVLIDQAHAKLAQNILRRAELLRIGL